MYVCMYLLYPETKELNRSNLGSLQALLVRIVVEHVKGVDSLVGSIEGNPPLFRGKHLVSTTNNVVSYINVTSAATALVICCYLLQLLYSWFCLDIMYGLLYKRT